MEQKRTLTGDENGHEDSGSGIYNNLSLERNEARKKRKNRLLLPPAKKDRCCKPRHGAPPLEAGRKKDARIIRRLVIPDIFIPKPPPPIVIYRTGKVWSRKLPPQPPKKVVHAAAAAFARLSVAKSSSDSHLPANNKQRQPSRPTIRRHSHKEIGFTPHSRPTAIVSYPFILLDAESRYQLWLNGSTCSAVKAIHKRKSPCVHCLSKVNQVAQGSLHSDRELTLLLNDFYPTSVFQHLVLGM